MFGVNGVEVETHRNVEPSGNTVTSPVCTRVSAGVYN